MTERRGVLIVTNRLPYPLNDGWKRRTFHLVRGVASKWPVTIASLHDGGESEVHELIRAVGQPIEVVTVRTPRGRRLRSGALGLLTETPYHVWMQKSRPLRDTVKKLLDGGKFEAVIATLVHLFPYIEHTPPGTVRIVDTHNVDSTVLMRYAQWIRSRPVRAYSRATAAKLRSHEAKVFSTVDRVWTCSDLDSQEVLARCPAARVALIPNGVDASREFAPGQSSPVPGRLLFFGRLDYYPNQDAVEHFCEEILPRIRPDMPGVEFCVVGPGARPALRAYLERQPGCRLLGHVDDLRGTIASADQVIVPLRMGGGTRLKILEALAVGRPVVSTPTGAEGLALRDGYDLKLAATPAEFARAVVSLARDRALADRLAAQGQQTVRAAYEWRIIEGNVAREVEASLNRVGQP